jgi:hypothetical protein
MAGEELPSFHCTPFNIRVKKKSSMENVLRMRQLAKTIQGRNCSQALVEDDKIILKLILLLG